MTTGVIKDIQYNIKEEGSLRFTSHRGYLSLRLEGPSIKIALLLKNWLTPPPVCALSEVSKGVLLAGISIYRCVEEVI